MRLCTVGDLLSNPVDYLTVQMLHIGGRGWLPIMKQFSSSTANMPDVMYSDVVSLLCKTDNVKV